MEIKITDEKNKLDETLIGGPDGNEFILLWKDNDDNVMAIRNSRESSLAEMISSFVLDLDPEMKLLVAAGLAIGLNEPHESNDLIKQAKDIINGR